ncbi:MAG TPA: hypothetical protein VGY13_00320 [Solirubrobacteraceae bacterium]|nr:hypothetical protein [Solirubrobacteraceae bacterium]
MCALAAVVALASAQSAAARPSPHPVGCDASEPALLPSFTRGGEVQPQELASLPEASILASFAIFRRAASPSDQLPPLNPASGLDYGLASYYPAYVRQLDLPGTDGRAFVIPGFQLPYSIPPARCLSPSLGESRAKLVEEAKRLASEPVYCIVETGTGKAASLPECAPFARIDEGGRMFAADLSRERVIDLVPDGVASVRLVYRSGPPIVAGVSEDAIVYEPPKALYRHAEEALKRRRRGLSRKLSKLPTLRAFRTYERLLESIDAAIEPVRVEWIGAAGTVVRTIPRPAPTHGLEANL